MGNTMKSKIYGKVMLPPNMFSKTKVIPSTMSFVAQIKIYWPLLQSASIIKITHNSTYLIAEVTRVIHISTTL